MNLSISSSILLTAVVRFFNLLMVKIIWLQLEPMIELFKQLLRQIHYIRKTCNKQSVEDQRQTILDKYVKLSILSKITL